MSYDSWLAEPYEYPDRYAAVEADPEAGKCVICGDEEIDMENTWRGTVCSSCTRKCLWCEDWMEKEDGVQLDDGCMHKACHEDWKRERNGVTHHQSN